MKNKNKLKEIENTVAIPRITCIADCDSARPLNKTFMACLLSGQQAG